MTQRVSFSFGGAGRVYRVVEATAADAARVQHFFEAHPDYFVQCEGRAPEPAAGREFVVDRPPAEFSFRAHHNLVIVSDAEEIEGVLAVSVDLLSAGVWHLGLLIVATRWHGGGLAQAAHEAYEAWARAGGARWLRLGVVEQNGRARRFWQRQGYTEIRRREGVAMGELRNTVLVMCKPVADAALDAYLAAVPRDRPDA